MSSSTEEEKPECASSLAASVTSETSKNNPAEPNITSYLNFSGNSKVSPTKGNASGPISSMFSADGSGEFYSEFIKRKTPRIGTLFLPNDITSGETHSLPASFSHGLVKHYAPNPDSSFMKVHTGVQVGSTLEKYESRRIVGQEDDMHDSGTRNVPENQQRSGKWASRPPVVGQASSSSNDSVQLVGRVSESEGEDVNRLSDAMEQNQDSAYFGNTDNKGQVSTSIANRDDYISERPPEGSSEQVNLSQQELQTEVQRVRSPSSVSSAASASVRPLEWDSGADVGYHMFPSTSSEIDPGLSTIERIALARGSAALLTRSDPEGTTEQGNNIIKRKISQVKPFIKDRLGIPVAESTPFSTTNKNTPYTGFISESEEDISPIAVSSSTQKKSMTNETVFSKSKGRNYVPLFPELNNTSRSSSLTSKNDQKWLGAISNNKEEPHGEHSPSDQVKLISDENINIPLLDSQHKMKKLSSSMEILHSSKDSKLLPQNELPSTLPRSQSHSNISGETNCENMHTFPKGLHTLRNLYSAKSASSSSVSTVVQKRKDSPKRISKLVQTSFLQQSVGIQASDNDVFQQPVFDEHNAGKEKSSSVCQEIKGRSSYFSSVHRNEKRILEQKSSLFGSGHSHNGSPCTGARKKTTKAEILPGEPDFCLESHMNGSNSQNYEQRNQLPNARLQNIVGNTGTMESVESSALSGQNTWPDRRESMAVEDRVNSFEYLPGHVFENTARHENESRGTSSISLHQEASSQNEFSDGTDKLWDTSASSTLLRDIDRGVNIIRDFVENCNANDDQLKQKLIKKVVEKLIKTDYPEDKLWIENALKGNVPWIPVQFQNVTDQLNGRETRRSHNKESTVSNEASGTRSEKSSSRTSSKVFIPEVQYANQSSGVYRQHTEKCVGTDNSLNFDKSKILGDVKRQHKISTSDVTTESGESSAKPNSTAEESNTDKRASRGSAKSSSRRKSSNQFEQEVNSSSNTTNTTSERSGSADCSGDWRMPSSKAEKLYEEKRKKQERVITQNMDRKSASALMQYLNIERENQLLWIRSEIQHLSNLKRLLEKQEELKKSLTKLRKPKARSILTVVNDKNAQGPDTRKYIRRKLLSNLMAMKSGRSHCKPAIISHLSHILKSYPRRGSKPRLKLQNALTGENQREDCSSVSEKTDCISQDSSGWTSHNYSNLKKSPSYQKNKENQGNINSVQNQVKQSVDSKHSNCSKPRQSPVGTTSVDSSKSNSEHDKDSLLVRLRRNASTETTGNVAVQTSKSVHQLPVIKPEWYLSMKKSHTKSSASCSCLKNGSCKCTRESKDSGKSKGSVAYYIIFDKSPSHQNKSEGKQSVEKKFHKHDIKDHDGRNSINAQSNTDTAYFNYCIDQKENYKPQKEVQKKHQRPTLQDYLLKNKADYVSRAEYRRRCVAELAYLRELRDKSKRQLLAMAPESSDYSQYSTPRDLPPPPLAIKRVFSQRTMRRQTERKYRQLAEVQSRQIDMKRKEAYRTNRLMAEVFTKKLQRRALKGEVNLSNSVSVISSL